MFRLSEILDATAGKLISGNPAINIKGISIDSRTIKPDELFIAIKGQNLDGHNFIKEAIKKNAKAILLQNTNLIRLLNTISVRDLTVVSVPDTIKALGDIARYQRHKFNIPVIAITGSNGKTTTKEMIAHLLSSKFKVLKNEGTQNNQIGLPLTLLKLNRRFNIAVLELGTNHFGEIEYLSGIACASVAVITNIGPSHLEFFGGLQGVFQEKNRILENLLPPRLCLLNSDDRMLFNNILSRKKFQNGKIIFTFGINRDADLKVQKIVFRKNFVEFFINKERFILNTIAPHNVYNALVAILLGRIFGLSYSVIRSKLNNFEFLSGRLKTINLRDNIEIIDDTYNSNPLSLKEALDVFNRYPSNQRKIFVMGDMLELGQNSKFLHRKIGKIVANSSVNIFFTLGNLSKFTAEAANNRGPYNKIIRSFDSKERLNRALLNLIGPGDSILIKGSRSMRMEEIVHNLLENLKT